MPDYPTIPQYPEQGIQAELDLVYLWNPNAASELLAELNRMIAEVREMIDEIDLTPYRTAADQDIIDQDLQEQINTKQAIIEDLETIRSGAAAGATAVQPGDLATVATTGQYSDLIGNPTLGTAAAADVSDFATAAQGLLADTAVQPADIADMETQTHASNTYATQTTVSGIAEEVRNIQELIPAQATSLNQLADKEFVNSSISTNTANFIGTFRNVSDLRAYSGTVTNNDYAFVTNDVITDNGNDWASFADLNAYDKTLLTMFDYAWVVNGTKFDLYRFEAISQIWVQRATAIDKSSVTLNPVFNRYKATVSSGTTTWEYEYTLNNSSFTASQWTSINSGSTAESVALANSSLQPGDNVSDLINDAGYLTAHQSLTDLGITATASELNVLDGITADTTELNYVDGVTSSIQTQLDSKQATLVNQSNIKSINGNSLLGSGDLQVNSRLGYPQSWNTGGTTKAFCDDINADASAVEGMAYIGEVTLADMPGTLGNAECVVEVMMSNPSTKTITLTLTSGNVSPYMWKYTYWSNGTYVSGWIGYQPELVSGTNIKTINNNSLLGSGDITINSLPSQSGQSGKFLTTDGTDASWSSPVVATFRVWGANE